MPGEGGGGAGRRIHPALALRANRQVHQVWVYVCVLVVVSVCVCVGGGGSLSAAWQAQIEFWYLPLETTCGSVCA